MKTIAIVITCLVAAGFVLAPAAYACSCIVPPAPLVALGEADAVFSGKVVSIQTVSGQYGRRLLVQFEVRTLWKGDLTDRIIVETADNSAACGYPFQRGKEYLVYSHLYESILSTGICARTSLLSDASEDVRELGSGEEIIQSKSRCGGPTNLAAMQTFFFLAIGIAVLRRRNGNGIPGAVDSGYMSDRDTNET